MSEGPRVPFGGGGEQASYRACCTLYARQPQPCFVASVLRQLVSAFSLHHVVVERQDRCHLFPSLASEAERRALLELAAGAARQLRRAVGFLTDDHGFVLTPAKLSMAPGRRGGAASMEWASRRMGRGRPIALTFQDALFETTFVLDPQEMVKRRLRRLAAATVPASHPELGMEWWQDEARGDLYVRWRYYQLEPLQQEDRRLRQAWESTNCGDFEFLRLISAYSGGPRRFAACEARGAAARAYKEALGYPG